MFIDMDYSRDYSQLHYKTCTAAIDRIKELYELPDDKKLKSECIEF